MNIDKSTEIILLIITDILLTIGLILLFNSGILIKGGY